MTSPPQFFQNRGAAAGAFAPLRRPPNRHSSVRGFPDARTTGAKTCAVAPTPCTGTPRPCRSRGGCAVRLRGDQRRPGQQKGGTVLTLTLFLTWRSGVRGEAPAGSAAGGQSCGHDQRECRPSGGACGRAGCPQAERRKGKSGSACFRFSVTCERSEAFYGGLVRAISWLKQFGM